MIRERGRKGDEDDRRRVISRDFALVSFAARGVFVLTVEWWSLFFRERGWKGFVICRYDKCAMKLVLRYLVIFFKLVEIERWYIE